MTTQLFPETLPAQTASLVELFHQKKPSFLNEFYLSGGTALSLQLGHRESEDLDFFIQQSFQPEQLQHVLTQFGTLENTELAKGTLNTFIRGVKLQFLEYPYSLLEPVSDFNGLRLSSVLDIACTKLQTISMRGSKKDFFDLFFILEEYSITSLFESLKEKYQKISYSELHILKSLVYFEDADHQPMPKRHKEVSWEQVKATIIAAVKQISI